MHACMHVQVRASLSLFLSDDDVGAVLGRKGQNLVDIQQVSRRCMHAWAMLGGARACEASGRWPYAR